MSTIAFTLNTLLACLIITPFVIFAGAQLIGCYFNIKQKMILKSANSFMDALIKNQKGKEESNAQKNL